jgi:SAM-dependent methyltransferase
VRGYGDDLAYIHDAGHRGYALGAAPGLLRILRRHGVRQGLVVDLGCGSGRWARELNRAGYRVLGIDQSPAMIRLARRIAPGSRFEVASLLSFELPACDAVTSLGECLNYCFEAGNSRRQLQRLFRRAYRALRPGGVFVFDVAGPGRLPREASERAGSEGPDWAVLVEKSGDRKRGLLERRIISFRRIGRLYRRSEEIHRLRLYRIADLAADLRGCGFRVRRLRAYGRFRLPDGIGAMLAVKPRE